MAEESQLLQLARFRGRASVGEPLPMSAVQQLLYKFHESSSAPALNVSTKPSDSRTRQARGGPIVLCIIGGGFSGSYIAKQLAGNPSFKVYLITQTPWFENKPVLLRQLVDPSIDASIAVAQDMVKHSTYMPAENVIVGEVKDLTPDRIILADETLEYDYCVVATGRDYNISDGVSYTASGLGKLALKLKYSKRVLIIGGGPVGVEMSAEVIAAYPETEVILVARSKTLVPRMTKKAQASAWIHLRSKGVKVITSEECVQKDVNTVTTKSGNYTWSDKEEGTLFLWCIQGAPRTSFMEKHFAMSLDPEKFIKVDEHFRVAGLTNVFAAGDVISLKEEKLAERAIVHAEHIVEHLSLIVKNSKHFTRRYKPMTKVSMMVLSLGPNNAIAVSSGKMMAMSGPAAAKLKKTFLGSFVKRLREGTAKSARNRMSAPRPSHQSSTKVLIWAGEVPIAREIAKQLVTHMEPGCVRMCVPPVPPRSVSKLKHQYGVELVEVSPDAPHTVGLALKGISTFFLPLLNQPKQEADVKRVVDIAKQSGVKFICLCHGAGINLEVDRSIAGEWALQSEEVVKNSGIPYAIVRHVYSLSSISNFHSRSVRLTRALRIPVEPNLRLAWIHHHDIAKAAVALLLKPSLAAEKHTFELTGAETTTGEELATALSEAIGDTVYFVPVPKSDEPFWAEELALSKPVAAAMSSLFSVIRSGCQSIPTGDFATLVPGESQGTVTEWAKENAHAFL